MNTLFSARHNFTVDAFGCSFTVYGKAEPGGSKRAFPNRKTGKIIVTDDNPKAAAWKQEIGIIAGQLMKGRNPYEGPLQMFLTIYRERPKGHYGRHGVKPSAPKFPTTKPDATKCLRPIEDAMTGIVWGDDAQVCDQRVRKLWCATGEEPRVEVRVAVLL